MAKNYEYKHTHIALKHGYATFIGKDFKPSKELLDALNKMAELAYEQCGRLKVDTGENNALLPDVSGSALPCKHPADKLVDWHDDSVLCLDCNCIVSQFGENIDPPTPL